MNPKDKYQNLNKLGNLTTKYGGKTRYEKFHHGVDIANRKGTPIPAFSDGKIIGVKPNSENDESYGNSILLRDKFGNTHRYSHLFKILVKPGQEVKKDQVIAQMGDSGSAYSENGTDASHLDFRIVSAYKNQYKDPTSYIKKYV